ncbi:MAG TPA: phenylalanine 4-monooxygenase, partial [Segetibacter sp.]
VECRNVCTVVYSSGLQVTGVFTDVKTDADGSVSFIKTTGPSALSYDNKQIEGHDRQYHKDGFSSTVGKLKGYETPLEDASLNELSMFGISVKGKTVFNFESGFTVIGWVKELIIKNGKLLTITFTNCTVRDRAGGIYFKPEWGNYDMAVGDKIVSVFCGAADKNAYNETTPVPRTKTHQHVYTQQEQDYQQLFKKVRYCREQRKGYEELPGVWRNVKQFFPGDWLCALEILEILRKENLHSDTAKDIRAYLENKAATEPHYNKLISDGFYLIKNPVVEFRNL